MGQYDETTRDLLICTFIITIIIRIVIVTKEKYELFGTCADLSDSPLTYFPCQQTR